MAYYTGFEIEPTIALGTPCLTDVGAHHTSGFEITSSVVLGGFYVTDIFEVHLPAFEIIPEIEMGEWLTKPNPFTLFYAGTEIWVYAEASSSTEIVTDGSKTFYPGFLLVVGKLLDFVGAPRYGRATLTVQFTDLSSPMVTNWLWNFGDGNYSIIQHPSHDYKNPGVYTVTLRVTIGGSYYYCIKKYYIVVWPGGLKVANTNKSYRFAMKPEQGRLWSELGGPGMIFPESRIGTFQIYTDKDQPILLITDARTGVTYTFATRTGPVDSGIVKRWVDRFISGYDVGFEIPWRLKFKEHRGEKPHNLIRYLLAHLGLRPQSEAKKNTEGYDANGFRDAQQIGLRIYENGDVNPTDVAKDLPPKADMMFDEKHESNRLQLEAYGTASELKVTNLTVDYENIDIRGKPAQRTMSEGLWQQEFGQPLVKLSRSDNLKMNLATQVEAVGTVYGGTMGPDNKALSAMVFMTTNTLTMPIGEDLDGSFTCMFYAAAIVGTIEIVQIGTATISIIGSGGVYTLRFNDNGTTYDQILNWSGGDWVSVKISRFGQQLIFSEGGVQRNSSLLSGITTYTGNVVIPSGNPKYLFDLNIFPSRISEDAYNYYNDDVVNKNGKSVLPNI